MTVGARRVKLVLEARVKVVYSLDSGTIKAICQKTGKVRVLLDGGRGYGWHRPEELMPEELERR